MSEYCFICAKLLTESEVVTVERAMKTLINASSKFWKQLGLVTML